jgi:hypothetical protein
MLNKFAGPEDEAFQAVSYYLKEFAENAIQNSQQICFPRSFQSTDMHSYLLGAGKVQIR